MIQKGEIENIKRAQDAESMKEARDILVRGGYSSEQIDLIFRAFDDRDEIIKTALSWMVEGNKGEAAKLLLTNGYSGLQIETLMEVAIAVPFIESIDLSESQHIPEDIVEDLKDFRRRVERRPEKEEKSSLQSLLNEVEKVETEFRNFVAATPEEATLSTYQRYKSLLFNIEQKAKDSLEPQEFQEFGKRMSQALQIIRNSYDKHVVRRQKFMKDKSNLEIEKVFEAEPYLNEGIKPSDMSNEKNLFRIENILKKELEPELKVCDTIVKGDTVTVKVFDPTTKGFSMFEDNLSTVLKTVESVKKNIDNKQVKNIIKSLLKRDIPMGLLQSADFHLQNIFDILTLIGDDDELTGEQESEILGAASVGSEHFRNANERLKRASSAIRVGPTKTEKEEIPSPQQQLAQQPTGLTIKPVLAARGYRLVSKENELAIGEKGLIDPNVKEEDEDVQRLAEKIWLGNPKLTWSEAENQARIRMRAAGWAIPGKEEKPPPDAAQGVREHTTEKLPLYIIERLEEKLYRLLNREGQTISYHTGFRDTRRHLLDLAARGQVDLVRPEQIKSQKGGENVTQTIRKQAVVDVLKGFFDEDSAKAITAAMIVKSTIYDVADSKQEVERRGKQKYHPDVTSSGVTEYSKGDQKLTDVAETPQQQQKRGEARYEQDITADSTYRNVYQSGDKVTDRTTSPAVVKSKNFR